MIDDINEILNHLISTPRQSQIQIDFDLEKKIFLLSIPIYVAKTALPRAVKEYIEVRKNRFFKPHVTSFQIDEERVVKLVQTIPFRWGVNVDSRNDLLDFYCLAQRCHKMLHEIALEETCKTAMNLSE